MRLFTRNGTNHILHLLLTVLLCGTWLLVWPIIALANSNKPYFCTVCGYADRTIRLADPYGTQREQNKLLAWVANEQNSWKLATIVLGVLAAAAGIFYFTS